MFIILFKLGDLEIIYEMYLYIYTNLELLVFRMKSDIDWWFVQIYEGLLVSAFVFFFGFIRSLVLG